MLHAGLEILAWALQRCDFPPHDEKVDPITVTNALDFLDHSAEELLNSPQLRPHSEIQTAREWLYDVHCTLRGYLHWTGDGRLAKWIDQYLAAFGLDAGLVMSGGILTVDGKPLQSVDRSRAEEFECSVCERHRAVIWLAGEYPIFTELPVDT